MSLTRAPFVVKKPVLETNAYTGSLPYFLVWITLVPLKRVHFFVFSKSFES